jgi:peptide/nickel transport system permease protein
VTRRTRRRVGRQVVLCLLPLVLLATLAALLGLGAAAPPGRLDPAAAFGGPSALHPLGAGEAGIDLAAMVSAATLRGLALAISVALVGFVVGTPLGAAAALARGSFERFVARACDLLQAFPTFLFAMAVLSAVRHPTRLSLGVVFASTAWAPFARLALQQTAVLRGSAFVEAAFALGAGRARVVFLHLVPNLLGVVAVQLGSSAAAVLLGEAALSFVGFGPEDGVSLGQLLDQGVVAMLRDPSILVLGAGAITAASASLLVAGRAFAAGQTASRARPT